MVRKTYIIILNYKGWQDTIECLESVLNSSYSNYQIIVVDNKSPNNSMDYLLKWAKGELYLWLPDSNKLKYLSFPLKEKPIDYVLYTEEEALKGGDKDKEAKLENPIVFIQMKKNKGFAAGNNVGIKYALAKDDFEYIWLLNNDTVIEKDSLKNFIENIEKKEEEYILFGSIQYYYDQPNKIQAVGGGFNKYKASFWNYQSLKDVKNIKYIYGASMFFKKEFFRKIGLLNEKYFLYYEEIDLAERLKRKKMKQKVIVDIKVFHKHSKSISKESKKFREYYLEKGKIQFYKKYYKLLLIVPILKVFLKYFKTFDIFYLKSIKDGLLK